MPQLTSNMFCGSPLLSRGKPDVQLTMTLGCWLGPGRWRTNALSCAVVLWTLKMYCGFWSSVQFCLDLWKESGTSFHSLLQNPSCYLNALWFTCHPIPASLQDVSSVAGIHHWQLKEEKTSGTEEAYSNPSYGFPDGKDKQLPLLLHSSHHALPWSPHPLTGIVLSDPVVPCCCKPRS